MIIVYRIWELIRSSLQQNNSGTMWIAPTTANCCDRFACPGTICVPWARSNLFFLNIWGLLLFTPGFFCLLKPGVCSERAQVQKPGVETRLRVYNKTGNGRSSLRPYKIVLSIFMVNLTRFYRRDLNFLFFLWLIDLTPWHPCYTKYRTYILLSCSFTPSIRSTLASGQPYKKGNCFYLFE